MAVMHDGTRTWVDGVKGFHAGQFASSPHGCQARVLETLGEPLTYDDLVCYGAFAFRAGLHVALCPSAGHPCCGYMCIDGSNRADRWRRRCYESFPWSEPKADRAAFEAEVCAAVRQSIDRGIPVNYVAEEEGLIIGYADEGRRWWCLHPYHRGGSEAFWHDEATGFAGPAWPWAVVVCEAPKPEDERVSHRELLTAALAQAVDMWKTEQRGDYYVGEAAYMHWLDWLRGIDSDDVADPAAGMQGNGWCLDVLVQNRRIAGHWLGEKSGDLGEAAAPHLRTAAARYARIPEVCLAGLDCTWSLALPPERFSEWTSAMRRDQVARLETAREHDGAAIQAVESALAALR